MRPVKGHCRIIPQTWANQEMGLGGLYHVAGAIFFSGHLLAGWGATLPGVREQASGWGEGFNAALPLFARWQWRARACVGVAALCMGCCGVV